MVDRPAAPPPNRMRADHDMPLRVVRPGLVRYRDAWSLQQALVARRREDEIPDTLLLLEHPPVYTLGKRADRANVLLDAPSLETRGIELVEVDRGGDVTYHGPGQLVGYPILRLASLRGIIGYIRALEEVLIRALASFDLVAQRVEGLTGVWVGEAKIAAIGVRVASGGVTSHGFALNVDPVMEDFAGIVPCGIADRDVCSLASLGIRTRLDEVGDRVLEAVAEVFGATLDEVDARVLDPSGAGASITPSEG